MMDDGSHYLPLHEVLTGERAAGQVVAIGTRAPVTWAELRRDVAALCQLLRGFEGNRWGLCCDDTYAFAVALLALLHEGRIPVLPPNSQEGSLSELAARVDGFVSDLDTPATSLPILQPLGLPAPAEISFRPLSADEQTLELFTSGTTGDRKGVRKTLAQLSAEVAVLERLWGGPLGASKLVASVSHQHIYGLLFRVLWPLAGGRPFHRRVHMYPDQLASVVDAHAPCTLISTPAHLERIPELIDLHRLRGRITAVYSSGSMLSEAVATHLGELLGVTPIEVLGSTETGGVAWRQQSPGQRGSAWRPLPGVAVRASGEAGILTVRSPYVSGDDWFAMGDRIEPLADGCFQLLGRHDRIVKIGGKRLALRDLEERLLHHPWVEEVVALQLPAHGAVQREIIGCALELSAAGQLKLAELGRRETGKQLRQALQPFFATVHLPKRWRFVDTIPVDAQGKRTQDVLQPLFGSPSGTPKSMPEIRASEVADNRVSLELRVPPDLAYLDGHFPGMPVVAGVVQLHWLTTWAGNYLRTPPHVAGIEVLKFHRMLGPGALFSAKLEWEPERQTLTFRLFKREQTYTSGRLLLAEDTPPPAKP